MQGLGTVTFNATAQDSETTPLTFSWTASTGLLGEPESIGTRSAVTWTAPAFAPAGTPVTVTVTVTDADGLAATQSFHLTVSPGALSPALSVGYNHSLALRGDGTVWAWGNNEAGQLGDGTLLPRLSPIQVPGLSDITAIAAGVYCSLALRGDGTVWA